MYVSRSELPWPVPWNYMESDLGCTSRIYFDNVTLTVYNVTLTSQTPCQCNNKFDCSETNGYNIPQYDIFSIKYLYSDILLNKNLNFIYAVDRIMDYNRAEPTCYRTNFLYASSG